MARKKTKEVVRRLRKEVKDLRERVSELEDAHIRRLEEMPIVFLEENHRHTHVHRDKVFQVPTVDLIKTADAEDERLADRFAQHTEATEHANAVPQASSSP